MSAEYSPEPLVTIDFQDNFPHKFWISNWSRDESYPNGFRYKILSVRNRQTDYIEFLVVLEERSGYKTEMHHADVRSQAFPRISEIFVEGLRDEHNLDFQEQDFSETKTSEEFDVAIKAFGWKEL